MAVTDLPDVDTQSWLQFQAQQFQQTAEQDINADAVGHAFQQGIEDTQAWADNLLNQPQAQPAAPQLGGAPEAPEQPAPAPETTPPAGPEAVAAPAQPPADTSQVGPEVSPPPASAPDLTQPAQPTPDQGVTPPLTGVATPPQPVPPTPQPLETATPGVTQPLTGIAPTPDTT